MDAARVAKNSGFLYARIVINILVALYSTRIILEALGVEDFGIYNLVAGVIAMLSFLNSAMAEASQRFMAFAHGEENLIKQKRVFNVSIILHFLIAVAVVIILEIAGFFLFDGVLEIPEERVYVAKLVYQFMLISTFFTIVKVPYVAVLNAHENMFIVAVLGVVHAFIKLGIALYVKYTSFDKLIVYGLLMALLAVSMIVISFLYCHAKYTEVRYNPRKYFDKALFYKMGTFASWSFLIQAAYILTMQGTTIILNTFFGVVINAAQGVANQVSNQLRNFSVTIQQALNPVIVKREGKKDRAKMLEASMFGNKISFFVMSIFSVPLLIEMPAILNIWLKDVPEFAVIFCRLQMVRLIIGTLTQSFFVAIGAIGQIKHYSIWESIMFIIVIPISYILFKFGADPEIIYFNLVVLGLALSVIRVYFLKKLGGLSVNTFLKNVVARSLIVFVISFLIALIPTLFNLEDLVRLAIVIFSGSVTFLFLTYYVGLNLVERKQVLEVVKHFREKVLKSKN